MIVIFLTDYSTRCYRVTFQNLGWIKIQKLDDISDYENNICYVNPLGKLLGKSEVCDMTLKSGALNKSVFDGNTVSLKLVEENDRKKYSYIGGDMICSFLTNDNTYTYISNMGKNLKPYSMAIGEENISFLTPHFKFIKREKINDNELSKTNKSSVDPFNYHVSNCGRYSFKQLRLYKIHSNND